MSSQGAISSLAYSSGAVVTAASMGYVFGRPTKSKKNRKSSQSSYASTDSGSSIDISSINNISNVNNIPTPPSSMTSSSSSSTSSSFTITNVSPISPLKRFKLFRSKSKRSKLSSSTYILPPTTIHPLVVRPDQLADDDVSSIYSDATSLYTMNDRDRRTLSVPNLPATLYQSQNCDNSPSMSLTSGAFVPRSVTETLHEEDEEENWDEDSGFNEPLSKTARISTPSLPISTPPRRHSRCKSLPPTSVKDFSPSLYHRQPTPSENWDEDFDLDDELNVPSQVEESQFALRMDISNIRDFVYHIGELKTLVNKKEKFSSVIQSRMTRKWTNGFLRTTSKKVKELEILYKKHWEEAAVIIDIADVAEDNEATFGGGKRVEVDIERIPSERHLKIFKKIVVECLGDEAKDLVLFDDDKENHYSIPSKNIAKKQKLMMPFFIKNNDHIGNNNEGSHRKENFRMSVEVMPSLIEYLKKLQSLLDGHVNELGKLNTRGT